MVIIYCISFTRKYVHTSHPYSLSILIPWLPHPSITSPTPPCIPHPSLCLHWTSLDLSRAAQLSHPVERDRHLDGAALYWTKAIVIGRRLNYPLCRGKGLLLNVELFKFILRCNLKWFGQFKKKFRPLQNQVLYIIFIEFKTGTQKYIICISHPDSSQSTYYRLLLLVLYTFN